MRMAFRIMLRTGLRASEVLALRQVDLRLDQDLPIIVVRADSPGNKEKKGWEVPVPADLVENLRDLASFHSKDHYRPMMDISHQRIGQVMKEEAVRTGIDPAKAHPHAFRHTYGRNSVLRGVPIPVLQKWLGHASMVNTPRYVELAGRTTNVSQGCDSHLFATSSKLAKPPSARCRKNAGMLGKGYHFLIPELTVVKNYSVYKRLQLTHKLISTSALFLITLGTACQSVPPTPAEMATSAPTPMATPSNTVTQAFTVPPVATKSLQADPNTRNGAGIDTSECRGCGNAAELILANSSDSSLALQEYFGEWIRLGGRVASISGSGGMLELEVPISGRPPGSIYLQGEPRDEWLEWVLSYDPGDTVEANCFVRENPSGKAIAVRCRPIGN